MARYFNSVCGWCMWQVTRYFLTVSVAVSVAVSAANGQIFNSECGCVCGK
jgi:hypothetical protein